MAGTLELSEDLCWMPAGWIYDNALQGIAQNLGNAHEEWRRRLLGALTDVNGGYLDIQQCKREELRTLETALSSLIGKIVAAGRSAFHDPSFYEGYVQQLHELQSLLTQRLNQLNPAK